MTYAIEEWGRDAADRAAALVAAACVSEDLSADELLAVCWEDPAPGSPDRGAVLGTDDGLGVVAIVMRAAPAGAGRAFVKLVAVHPEAQRAGRGHALLHAAEQWAWAHGAGELLLAGAPPFYLWPGIDAGATPMLCLAESRGYERFGSGMNMAMTTAFRAPAPEGVVIRRVIHDDDVARLDDLLRAHWPDWRAEAMRAVEHGCCHGAFVTVVDAPGGVAEGREPAGGRPTSGGGPAPAGQPGAIGAQAGDPSPAAGSMAAHDLHEASGYGADADERSDVDRRPGAAAPHGQGRVAHPGGGREIMVGFACHSVSRAGWLGPMGTDPARRAAGVGRALLGQVCRDLMIAEYDRTEICWAGPLRFYAKSGATISRTFLQYRLPRP